MMVKNTNNNDKMNDDDNEPEKKLCTKQACAIQYCLNRYNHQEKYCKVFIDEWKRCKDMVRGDKATATNNQAKTTKL